MTYIFTISKMTNSSLSAAWKTLVSGTVKLFHKFERGHPNEGRQDVRVLNPTHSVVLVIGG